MLNDLIRTYKKIILAVVLLLCAILVWFFGCHRFAQDKDEESAWKQTAKDEMIYEFTTQQTTGTITFGTCGHLTSDRTQPVIMYISGRDADFSGTVRITLPGQEGKGVAYQAAVKCPKDVSRKVVLSVPKLGNVSFFSVELLDQYGTEELARIIMGTYGGKWKNDSDETTEKKAVGIGILSDKPEKLKWIDGLEISAEDTCFLFEVVAMNEKNLLEGPDILESLSGIIIDDFDSSRLNYRQKQCLKEWVEEKGGALILGTGARAGQVLAGMENLVGAGAGAGKIQSLQFYDDDESAGYLSVQTNEIKLSNQDLWNAGGISFPVSCYHRSVGKGKMMILTWSFAENVFSQWTGREKMAQDLLESVLPVVSRPNNTEETSIWYIKNTLYSWLASRTPNTFFYAIFFIVYISALVLFSYYFLRRTKKREYIWVIVPALSLFFTICLAVRAGGFGNYGTNSYSAIEILDSAGPLNEVFLLYQNNEGERNHASLVSDVSSVEPMDYSYRNEEEDVASLTRLRQDYTINNASNGYEIEFEEAVPGTSRLLQMKEKGDKGETQACFDTQLEADYTSFYGRIVNRSEWNYSKVMLLRGNQYVLLRDVKAGEEREIRAGAVKCWSLYDQDYSALKAEGDSLSGNLADYIRSRYTEENDDLNTIIIAGITADKEITLFQDQESIRNRQTILINRVALTTQPGLHYISNINRRCLGKNYAGSPLSRDTLEERKTKAVYQFDRDKVVWYAARNRDQFTGNIYAYNYRTGKEDLLFENPGDVIKGEKLEPYLSGMNKMILTFERKDGEDVGPAPLLTFVLKDVT